MKSEKFGNVYVRTKEIGSNVHYVKYVISCFSPNRSKAPSQNYYLRFQNNI